MMLEYECDSMIFLFTGCHKNNSWTCKEKDDVIIHCLISVDVPRPIHPPVPEGRVLNIQELCYVRVGTHNGRKICWMAGRYDLRQRSKSASQDVQCNFCVSPKASAVTTAPTSNKREKTERTSNAESAAKQNTMSVDPNVATVSGVLDGYLFQLFITLE